VVFGSIGYPWVTSWTDTQIVTTVPGNAQTAGVYVQNPGEAISNSMSLTVNCPAIASIIPSSAVVGQQITINGTYFGSVNGYVMYPNTYFGYNNSWTDNQIVTTVPTGAQSGPVYIYTPAGAQSNSVSFTVNPNITGISPTPAVAGQQLTITGTSFGSTSAWVVFGSIGDPWVTSWTDTQIVTPVPNNAPSGTVAVYVQNSSGAPSSTYNLTVVYPNIISIAPSPVQPGQQVTITGTNFGSANGFVVFGTIGYPWVTSWTDTQIVTPVPTNAVTGPVYIQNPGEAISNWVTLTVNGSGGTTTSLSSTSANPSPYRTAVALTATVTSSSGGTPTGTVTFYDFDGTVTLGSGTLNSGMATLTLSTLAPGAHSITATYNGDANDPQSTSAVWAQTVNRNTMTLPPYCVY
jgi:hypothetical protein